LRYQFDFSIIREKFLDLVSGAATTLEVSILAIVFGFLLGLLLALLRGTRKALWKYTVTTYVELIRNTPFLVQLFVVYFVLPYVGIRISPFPAGVIALSLNCGGYSAETIRAGIESIHEGQIDAGRALGMNYLQVFQYVVFKPAMATMFPALSSLFITLMLGSSILSAISTPELTSVAYNITAYYYRHFEVFMFISVVYLLFSILFSLIFKYIEVRFLRYELPRERKSILSSILKDTLIEKTQG
jgi:polar amino acid transport system permease protein